MTIFFARYNHKRLTKMLSLHCYEQAEKIRKHEEKNLLTHDYMLEKVLNGVKKLLGIEKLNYTKNAD